MTLIQERQNVKQYKVEIEVTKGWNLISSGLAFSSTLTNHIDESGDIKPENIKAIYAYSNKLNEYISNYPNYDERLYSANEYFKGDEQDIVGASTWIYVDKSGVLKYSSRGIKNLNETSLFSGWNFLSVTSEMNGKTINEIKGNCNIQKVAFWIQAEKKWLIFTETEINKKLSNDDLGGYGLIIKVSNDCKFVNENNQENNTPQIPNIPN